jgi:hypothetical protein
MDPYSAEGELINLHSHFHQGQYQEAADYDASALSPENALAARVLQLRARVALGRAEEVLAEVRGAAEPELQAVGALAELALGRADAAAATAEALAKAHGAANATVQVLAGTVLQAVGRSEEALALLAQHQGSRECRFVWMGEYEFNSGWLMRMGWPVVYSGCRRAHCADPSSAEQERPGREGGRGSPAVGAGQPAGEPGRGVGWVEAGQLRHGKVCPLSSHG